MVNQDNRIIVAVAASLSLVATSCLLIYVVTLYFLTYLNVFYNFFNKNNKKDQNNTSSYIYNHSNDKTQAQDWGKNSDGSDERIKSISSIQSWARNKLSFIRTPFGIMFVNLVMADFIQALGFGMDYVWVSKTSLNCHTLDCQTMCTIQGVLIQLGDLASAFSNLMIAIQTFVILTFSWHLPNWVTWLSIALIWVPVFVLTFLAPTIMGTWTGPKPFYTWAGDWCWINEIYSPLRLLLHYLWIFISAFGSIGLYGHLFLRLQIHFKKSKSIMHHVPQPTSPTSIPLTSPVSNVFGQPRSRAPVNPDLQTPWSTRTLKKICRILGRKQEAPIVFHESGDEEFLAPTKYRNNNLGSHRPTFSNVRNGFHSDQPPVLNYQADHLRKKLERKARSMLMYPIAFIVLILPLSTFRLAAFAGHDWGITAATVCGSMYCLSGFIDVLLFGTTRSIITVPVFSLNSDPRNLQKNSRSMTGTNRGGSNGIINTGEATNTVGGINRQAHSRGFRVEVVQETVIDLDDPIEIKTSRSSNHTNRSINDPISNAEDETTKNLSPVNSCLNINQDRSNQIQSDSNDDHSNRFNHLRILKKPESTYHPLFSDSSRPLKNSTTPTPW